MKAFVTIMAVYLVASSLVQAEPIEGCPAIYDMKLGMTKEQVREVAKNRGLPLRENVEDFDTATKSMKPNPDYWEVGEPEKSGWLSIFFDNGVVGSLSVQYLTLIRPMLDLKIEEFTNACQRISYNSVTESEGFVRGSMTLESEHWSADVRWNTDDPIKKSTFLIAIQLNNLDSSPNAPRQTNEGVSVRGVVEKEPPKPQEQEQPRRQKEQEFRSANSDLRLAVTHIITKKVPLQGLLGKKERYRYFFDVRNKSEGYTYLVGKLSIEMYYQEKQPIGSIYTPIHVNPNQGMTLYVDSRIPPQYLGGQGRFEYEFSVDNVTIRKGKGYFSSSYEDLTRQE